MLQEEKELLVRLIDYLLDLERKEPVVQPQSPESLSHLLSLDLEEEGLQIDELEQVVKELIKHTPKTSSRRFFNQLFGGREASASIGDILSVMLNTSMYTYKVAGPMVLVEQLLCREIADRIGYGDHAQGTMAPGGSMSNLMAMIMARDKADPTAKEEGVQRPLVGYTSEASHYSVLKNAALCGIGRSAIRKVQTDDQGRMLISDLQDQLQTDIKAGKVPFFINATAGTTVLGAFDDIVTIIEVAKVYRDIWVHVDGAYCGSVIWSRQHRVLLQGVDGSDSFSVNPHKMLGTPLSTSFLVVQDRSRLYASFSEDAGYLYQTADDDLNPGKISLQCGRRNDALKFWMLYKSKGHRGLEQMVDHQMTLAQQCRDYLRHHPDYTLFPCEQSVAVCFNYKDIPAEYLCNQLYEEGEMMVGYGAFRGESFVRLVIVNSQNSWDVLLDFFTSIEQFAVHKLIISDI